MVYYFADIRTRIAGPEAKALKAAFERLCLENAEFLRSLESTTKSLDATATRLELWGDEMHKVFGAKVKVARYSDGKISSS